MATILLNPQTLAALLSAIAAIAAALATWRGPIAAAKLAERMRRDSEADQESRRFRLNIFAILMQERAELYSADAVRALNSIDVAFSKSPPVKEAWAELFKALNEQPMPSNHYIESLTRSLLKEMALDLGISEKLRIDDLGRVYIPRALFEERQVRDLERTAALRRLVGNPAANTQNSNESPWPPRPDPG